MRPYFLVVKHIFPLKYGCWFVSVCVFAVRDDTRKDERQNSAMRKDEIATRKDEILAQEKKKKKKKKKERKKTRYNGMSKDAIWNFETFILSSFRKACFRLRMVSFSFFVCLFVCFFTWRCFFSFFFFAWRYIFFSLCVISLFPQANVLLTTWNGKPQNSRTCVRKPCIAVIRSTVFAPY